MGWLRRDRGQASPPPEAASKDAAAPKGAVEVDMLDSALDTLAAVVRALGKHAFDLDTVDRQTVKQDCERWAGHVLNAGPLPEEATPPAPGRRHWHGLRDFITAHRRAEQRFVEARTKALRDVMQRFVSGLRGLVSEDQQLNAQLERGFTTLEALAHPEEVNRLVEALPTVLKDMRHALEAHQESRQREMSAMHERLQALSEDLAATQARAAQDALTGLANRGTFDSRLRSAVPMAQVSGRPLTLFMVDLDHFKQINDTYGHPGGDEVLRQIAATLIRAFPRRDDFVARYGGEELAVLVSDADAASARRMATRLINAVRRVEITFEGRLIPVTCSVGYATLHGEEAPEAFLKRADAALYRAKAEGRDRAIPAEPPTAG